MEASAIAFKCRPFPCQMDKIQEFIDYYYHATTDETQKSLLLQASAGMRQATRSLRQVVENGP